MLKYLCMFFLLSFIVLMPNAVEAQEPAVNAEPVACEPACQAPYVCRFGTCEYACGHCQPGEVCSRAGHCIPPAPISAATQGPPPAPTAPATYTYQGPAPAPGATNLPYDPQGHEKYLMYKSRTSGGGALLTIGILGMTAAIVMAVAGAVGENPDLMTAAGFTELGSVAFFVPGLVMVITGNKGMRTYKSYASETGWSRAADLRLSPGKLSLTF